MAQPDPALGFPVAFPTDQVRNAFLFAMQLGAPTDPTRQVRFVKKGSGRRYFLDDTELLPGDPRLRLDRDGRPLNPQVRLEQTPDQQIAVDCAVEVTQAKADEIPVGNFRPVQLAVTLMEQEYMKITGCRELLYDADRYGFGYELEATGLFDLTMHTLIFFALNES